MTGAKGTRKRASISLVSAEFRAPERLRQGLNMSYASSTSSNTLPSSEAAVLLIHSVMPSYLPETGTYYARLKARFAPRLACQALGQVQVRPATTYRKSRPRRTAFPALPETGLEPVREYCSRGILSPRCLPISPLRRFTLQNRYYPACIASSSTGRVALYE